MKIFQKTIILLILFQLIVPDNIKYNLLKLPILFIHYSHHRNDEKNFKMNFKEFILVHYASNNKHKSVNDKKHKQEHDNLPFKKNTKTTASQFTYYVLSPIKYVETNELVFYEFLNKKNSNYKDFYLSKNYATIWQPPKIV